MKPERIESLLEKYFEGTTTLEEEALLRAYFNGGEVADSLLPYRPLFAFFEQESRQRLSDGFEQRLLDRLAAPPPRRVRRLWPALARAAAVGLLLLAAWWFYPRPETSDPAPQAGIDWSKYEPESPEEAYRITRMALMRASGELNNGAAKAAKEMEHLRELGRFVK